MNTGRMNQRRLDVEKLMITAGMIAMQCFGIVMLFCGIFDIRIL